MLLVYRRRQGVNRSDTPCRVLKSSTSLKRSYTPEDKADSGIHGQVPGQKESTVSHQWLSSKVVSNEFPVRMSHACLRA